MHVRTVLAGLAVFASVFARPRSCVADETSRITRIAIQKNAHTLSLYSGDRKIATYHAAIGPGGSGPKRQEGDEVTPVGRYRITMHQPSKYRVFLRLDYPNADDRARFAKLQRDGVLPRTATIGGDIGIHGPPRALPSPVRAVINASDWTLGCIAVDDDDILEIARRVPDGTIVDIAD